MKNNWGWRWFSNNKHEQKISFAIFFVWAINAPANIHSQQLCLFLLHVEAVVSVQSKLPLSLLRLPKNLFKNEKSSSSIPPTRNIQTPRHQLSHPKNQNLVTQTSWLHLWNHINSRLKIARPWVKWSLSNLFDKSKLLWKINVLGLRIWMLNVWRQRMLRMTHWILLMLLSWMICVARCVV
jgi:hypothetical protein